MDEENAPWESHKLGPVLLPKIIHMGSSRARTVPRALAWALRAHTHHTLRLVGGVRSNWQEGWVKPTCPEHRSLPPAHPRAQPSNCRAWELRRRQPSRSVRRSCRRGQWARPPCTCPWPSTTSRTSTVTCRLSAASTRRSECSAHREGTPGGAAAVWPTGWLTLGLPCGRAKAALGLERQIWDADKVIRGFESVLAQEAPIPAGPGALQERVSELQVRAQRSPGGRGHSLNKLWG